MNGNTHEGEVVRVSKKGQATIPKRLRDKFGIETPGRVYIREVDGMVVVEPLPSVEDLKGIHAGRYEEGEVLERLEEMRREEEQLERERDLRLAGERD